MLLRGIIVFDDTEDIGQSFERAVLLVLLLEAADPPPQLIWSMTPRFSDTEGGDWSRELQGIGRKRY